MTNEKRLIYLDDIFPNHCFYVNEKDPMKSLDELINRINNAHTVDAVPVVRCKDCKHYEIHRPKVLENCERNGYLIPMSPDDFCSYGERREG